MYTNEQLNAIFSSNVGFEFEFFSNNDLNQTKKDLSESLNKKIRVEEKAHSEFSPTQDEYKLEPDNSGGTGMIELVTGPTPFNEAKLVLAKTLKWIKENGSTNDRCSIHVNLAFDTNKTGTSLSMSKLDIGKFVLNFNEDRVYEEFPNRKDSVYAKSIKFIVPLNGMTQFSPESILWKNYAFVNEKYYGVNFTKIPKGYIEFRYLGGENYENKYNSILRLIEHFILSLYETLINPSYNKNDIDELKSILEKHKSVISSYRSYKNFKKEFPDIKLTVDLSSAQTIVEMYYPKMREGLFQILTKGGLTSGMINYDSDIGKLQIKDAELDKCFELRGVDVVDSTIKGNIIGCDIFNCDVKSSSLFECNVFGMSTVDGSKIEDSYVSRNVEVNDSYVFGERGVFSGKMNGGIFRKGRATPHATFDNAEVIEVEKIK